MLLKQSKIVLLTSGQPTLNPRLVKEADALISAGYEVTVIYQFWNEWATKYDRDLLAKKKWKAIRVGGSPKTDKFLFWKTRVKHKIFRTINKLISVKLFPESSIGRCSHELYKKAISIPADIYIAHNLPALPAAFRAAKKKKVKCGFDAEDFHRFENSDLPDHQTVKLNTLIENRYIPKIDYITAASDLISSQYQKLYNRSVQTILNVFPKTKFTNRKHADNHITELFWFSQTVGQNRGIEEVVLAIADLPEHNFELNLLGELTANDHEYFCRFFKKNNINKKLVKFHQPIVDSEIIGFASKYDIGLATETGRPFNRDICLTNKIFTYNQAGLAILATDTTAQKDLLSRYPNMGLIYKRNDLEDLKHKLLCYLDVDILENNKNQSYHYGQNMLNWETESRKFLAIIRKTLAS
jgi:glycosyltransferase involved in cell wall biosynthesis